ncbi:hypothetical protein [Terricaulis sp.]|uniref:hypothetical protein n=1 Tax=Terricaulis sp. TaxID=2768686 RepID=UPI003784B20B
MKSVTPTIQGLIFAASLALAPAAVADETSPSPATADQPSDEEVLSLEDLNDYAGGTGVEVIVDTDQVLTAVNSGNTVTGDTVNSGTLNIGSNAFSGFEGVGNFVMNTGHNNNLQSSMDVTVVMTPSATPGP